MDTTVVSMSSPRIVAAGESVRTGGCREGFPPRPSKPPSGFLNWEAGSYACQSFAMGVCILVLFGGERGGVPFQTHTPKTDAALSHEAPMTTKPLIRERSAEKKTLPRIYIFILCWDPSSSRPNLSTPMPNITALPRATTDGSSSAEQTPDSPGFWQTVLFHIWSLAPSHVS